MAGIDVRLRLAVLALVCLLFCIPALAAEDGPVEAVDGQGAAVRLAHPARRIICLYGAFGELYRDMGLGDRLVGRTKADADVPGLADLPSVGTHMRPSPEVIVGLRPDLVVQLAGRKEAGETVAALRGHGLTVAVFNPSNFEELFAAVRAMGILAGEPEAANSLEDSMRARLDAVSAALKGLDERPRVFFEVRSPDLLAAGRGGIVNDIIERAGGVNAVDSPRRIARLGEEGLIGLDPDAYVVQEGAMNRNPLPPAQRPVYAELRAVRQGRVLTVDEGLFSRSGPRAVEAVERLAAFLHPDRMTKHKE